MHWTSLPAQVKFQSRKHPPTHNDVTEFFRKEADGKNYIRYQVLGKNNVAVPTHFFKVIVMESENQKLDMEAYVMPNAVIANDTPLNVFQVS
jgi:endonuclease G, mitochondrial